MRSHVKRREDIFLLLVLEELLSFKTKSKTGEREMMKGRKRRVRKCSKGKEAETP
jgi:hypothetical protein